MDNVFVGKVVNTHGIKGELRIKSDFERKSLVFKPGIKIIIRSNEYIISSYRKHKDFDMVTLEGFDNINDVLFLKGANVYISRSALNLNDDEYLLSDLVDYQVICNGDVLGQITDYTLGINPLLCVLYNNKNYYIPYNGNYIVSLDKTKKEIYVIDTTKELII